MYNLLYEKWLSVLREDGVYDMIGINDALKEATSLQLAANNPMDRFAAFRFLLTVGYWCYINTEQPPIPGQALPHEWQDWLDKNSQYFELFHDKHRFWQDDNRDRLRPVTDLIHEIPTASNFWHLNHVTDYKDGLCPACCAKGLLRLPIFTTAGGRGIGAGINGTPPFYYIWMGKNLAETIELNWKPEENMGTPAWLLPQSQNESTSLPLLEGLTWTPRKVYLYGPENRGDRCALCGAMAEGLVYSINNDQIKVPDNINWKDPHAIYKKNDAQVNAKMVLMSDKESIFVDMDWYEPVVDLLRYKQHRKEVKIFLLGFTSDKAKFVDVWGKTFTIPTKNPDEDVLYQLHNRLWCINAMRKIPLRGNYRNSVGLTQVADIIPHVENTISSRISDLISGERYNLDDADREYRPLLKKVAASMEANIGILAETSRTKIMYRKPWRKKVKAKFVKEENND
ncbi:MAG: type I-E CRISPR-associated protein Cse1/CasA [Candidatus Cloacimonetes bacterium]|nr:type I-E CRISPR-associated protein Cse1/CasA [Candidatus Cloacimonadota bacterium]NLO12098.1 type I-E CRISPR-associated protein Cse1/CasA [Candidatus Cloacimonadota bacterium]